ncbi:acyl-CoA dehydrogenase family protein [Mycolicibacterium sp. 120270]|uniref:acyl-CoA dehydrogenase family protein n=1 Tax=Mycolicibacterium sp. 120270 TaxID=3090600 RepID=UPI00299D60EE|nr:acyl-CoA dehydrogenase family protein [Mycolicibacterium sp. 120270]MDX1884541.1 acyl-CoA dehydrogenase family protein [Mycolicibacterium sp. 120270]
MTDGASVLGAVRSLLPTIAAAAADVDRTGAVAPEVIRRLRETGYFALLQPRAFGGLEAEPDVYLTATRELSSACMSTGWLAGWLAMNNWGLSVRDPRVLQDIWGTDPSALLCSSYAPTGRLERADGGFLLSGRWSRCTGAHHATWLSAAALRVGPDGAAQDFMAVLVPRSDYVVESSWNGLGLRGIGADDVVVSSAFVPEHRAFSWLDLKLDSSVPPLDRLPQPTLYTLAGTMPLLGAAQRALAVWPAHETPALSVTAMAHTDVELSVFQIRRNVGDLTECVRAGGYPDAALMLRTRRDQVMASERAERAVRTMVQNRGDDDGLIERIWRDVQTARMHVASNTDQVLSVVGRFALGLDVHDLIW